MKLVKKFLRFLPCLFILGALISCCLYSIRHTDIDPISFFSLGGGSWDIFIDDLLSIFLLRNSISYEGPMYAFYSWFTENISNSYFIMLCLCILFYELVLSMAFIAFDFLNMVFSWCNKFIKKGSDVE